MVEYVSVDISASNFSNKDVMSMLADRLWTDDDIESMVEILVSICKRESYENNLNKFADVIISKLTAQ